MGISTSLLRLSNPRRSDLPALEVTARADTGSVFLVIPRRVQEELQLEQCGEKDVILADQSKRWVPYVGPLQVQFKNRTGFFGAVVMGEETLLGAIPMEDMDLVVIPRELRVEVNPASPHLARGLAKVAAN